MLNLLICTCYVLITPLFFRFHLILQVRQDLLSGKLQSPVHTLALLAAYWLQSEHGNYISNMVDLQLAETFQYVRKGTYANTSILESPAGCDIDFEEQVEIHFIKKKHLFYWKRIQQSLLFLNF